jgi:hypothetical protein
MLAIDDPLQPVLFLAGSFPVLLAGAWLLRQRTVSLAMFAAYGASSFLVGSFAASLSEGAPDLAVFLSMLLYSMPILVLCLILMGFGRLRREARKSKIPNDPSARSA